MKQQKLWNKKKGTEMNIVERIEKKIRLISSLISGKVSEGNQFSEEELQALKKENRAAEKALENDRKKIDQMCDEIIDISEKGLLQSTGESIVERAVVAKGFFDGTEGAKDKEIMLNEMEYTSRDIDNMKDYPEELKRHMEDYIVIMQDAVTIEEAVNEMYDALRRA